MSDDRNLDLMGDEPAPERAGRPQRRQRGRMWRRVGLAGAVLGVAAIAVGFWSSRADDRSAAETVAEIRSFVAGARTVRYALDDRYSESRIEGVARFPDRTRSTSLEGPYPWENITIGDAVYDRGTEKGEDLMAQQWVYADANDLQGPPGADEDFGGLLERTGVPLRHRPDRANLAEVLGALERVERIDGDTIRGTLPLAGLFTDPKLAQVMLDGTGSLTVTVTHGPGGRLDRLVWHLKARRLTVDANSCADNSLPYHFPSCFDERTVMDFSDWNAAVEIKPPPLDQIDPTPGIDEEAVAALAQSVRLAPTRLPADLRLSGISTSPVEPGVPVCPHVYLTYMSEATVPPSGSARKAGLEVRELACANRYDTEPITHWQVGGRRVDVLTATIEDGAAFWNVVVDVGASQVTIDAHLTETELRTLIASLGPLDLNTQPVYRSTPPNRDAPAP